MKYLYFTIAVLVLYACRHLETDKFQHQNPEQENVKPTDSLEQHMINDSTASV